KTTGNYYFSREWTLSSGDTINDFAGNVWEWFYETHNGIVDGNRRDYNYNNNISVLGNIVDPDTNISIPGIGTLSSVTAGLGQIYNLGAIPGSNYASAFGGHWANNAFAGIFTSSLYTNSPTSFRTVNIGFRCISPANFK
ncbi:MAG: hypothetical protein PHR68_05435, partial [Candidatus Gracilibacteria bacterium]|nr:hypothetical protein [Candidatus Gracilibacteria bacterium]